MPSDYASFQIENKTDMPIRLSVCDPDGNILRVGKLAPGKKSLQVAPINAAWSMEHPKVEAGDPLAPPPPDQPIRPPSNLPKMEVRTESLADLSNSESIHYEAFLKIETGSHTAHINQLLVTPEGKSLITSGADKTIRIWDVEAQEQRGMLLGEIGNGEAGMIQAISLSRDGRYLVALAWMYPAGTHDPLDRETDIRVYELATGNLQARFRYPGTLQDLDFSPDDEYLVIVGNPKDRVRRGYVLVYRKSDLLHGFGKAPAAVASEALYDYDALIPTYVRCVPEDPEKSAGCQIVVATWYDSESPGGLLWYMFASADNKGGLQNTAQCNLLVRPESLVVSREFVVVTGDTAEVEYNEEKYTIFCYDHHGNLPTRVLCDARPAKPIFSQNGTQLIAGQLSHGSMAQVKVYDIAFGQFLLKSTYYGHDSEVLAVGFLPDGAAVSAGGDQNEIHFWSPTCIEGERTGLIKGMGRVVHAVGIKESENEIEQIGFGNRNYLRTQEGNILLQRAFDLRSRMLRSLPFEESKAFRRAQTQMGDLWLEWIEEGTTPNLWLRSSASNEPLTGTWGPDGLQWYGATTFGFTDHLTIVTGDSEGKVRVAPRRRNKTYTPLPWRILVGHTARVLDHAPCGKWLVTAGADQVIRLWYLEDVEKAVMADLAPALNLFVGADDEWVLWSKSGYYMASQNGDRYLGYHVNRGPDREALFFTSDRFHSVFYRPDIIQAILAYGSEERVTKKESELHISIPAVDVAKILPPMIELDTNGSDDTEEGFVTFTLTARTEGGPITRLCVLRNGRLVGFKEFKEAVPAYAKITISKVRLLPGDNHFKIFAENQDAGFHTIKSNPIEQTKVGKGRFEDEDILENGMLYILAVGVSQGKNLVKREPSAPAGATFELSYAHEDADAIYNTFFTGNQAFEGVESKLLVNETATLESILQALDEIGQKINKRVEERVMNGEAAKRDVLLVFLSGHGVYRIPNQQLYFWNYEFDPNNPSATGLPFMKVGEKITSLPVEVVLMTDACHSGMAGSDVAKGFNPDNKEIDPDDLARRIYGINESDIYIFNAARRSESALEGSSIKHGYFTKAILDTLMQSTDLGVTMLSLIDQVQRRVSKDKPDQHPICRMYGDLLPLTIYSK
jgi:WD40 repeat protein